MNHTNPPKKLQDLNLMDRFLFSELKNCTLAKARQFLYLTYQPFAPQMGLGHKKAAFCKDGSLGFCEVLFIFFFAFLVSNTTACLAC